MLFTCGSIVHPLSALENMINKGRIIPIAVAKLLDIFLVSESLTRQAWVTSYVLVSVHTPAT